MCAGSYVPVDDVDALPVELRGRAGYYTVEDARPPAWITYKDLPEFFREYHEANRDRPKPPPSTFDPIKAGGRCSALYSVTARDIVAREGGELNPRKRWGSLFHDSTTEANMSLSKNGLIQCWRHGVSHNGLTSLVVRSGYMTCLEAGTPHKGKGQSRVVGDDGAIFHAWLYAKTHGYIPQDDPIPVRAMNYIAKKHHGYEAKKGEPLPRDIYRKVLITVEERY